MKKVANWAAFQAALHPKTASLAIISSDEFERLQAIEALLLCTQLPRKKVGVQNLLAELQAASFFDEKKIVHIDLEGRLKAKDQEIIQQALYSAHENVLLLTGSSLAKGLECELVLEIPEAKPWEKLAVTTKWLQSYLAGEKRAMKPKAVELLAKEFQHNRLLLKGELQKLFLYTDGKKEIEESDVEAICVMEAKPLLWHLSDALLQKNRTLALQYVAELQGGDVHPLQLLRLFRGQFHEALLGSVKPKHKQAFELYGLDGLQEALLLIDDLEVKLKNSEVDEQLQLELLVIQLCSTSSRIS